jgi:hypothetical protein
LQWIKRRRLVPSTGIQADDEQSQFAAAQAICIKLYRSLIRNDLLDRVLHPAVKNAYESGRVPVLNANGLDQGYWLAPLELTHGFLRFAHAMVRPRYRINDDNRFDLGQILTHNSKQEPWSMPFERKWLVLWQRFFGDDPTTDNFSLRIRPRAPQPFQEILQDDPAQARFGLVYRDLMSSIVVRPWSIGALADQIRPTHGELLNLSTLFRVVGDSKPWKKDVYSWLALRAAAGGLESADLNDLASDPPISFFVTFEAEHESAGKHLGILGSIVVADVLYGIFQNDRVMGVQSLGTLKSQLAALAQFLTGNSNSFSAFENIGTFQSAISFVVNLMSVSEQVRKS